MTKIEFDYLFEKLKSTYGKKAYPKERVEIIFEKCKDLEKWQLKKIIDQLIGDLSSPPKVRHFIEKAKTYQKRRSKTDIGDVTNKLNDLLDGKTVPREIVLDFIEAQKKFYTGEINLEQYKDWLETLRNSVKPKPDKCDVCKDRGLVFWNDNSKECCPEYVDICDCQKKGA